jgi:O-antigen/teichoic acid export membrane protein
LSTPEIAAPPIRLGRNAGLNLLGHALPVAVALLVMPVVVRGLGPAHFGLLALAWTVVSYAGFLDLGLGRAATKRVSEAVWTGEGSRVRRLATTVVGVQAILGGIMGGALWHFAPALARLLVADPSLQAEGAAILGVLGLGVPAVLVTSAYRSILEGLHRFDLVNLARAPLSAAIFLVSAAGVVAGASLPAIVGWLVVTRYAGTAVHGLLCRRAAPPGPGGVDPAALGGLLRFGGWVAVSNTIVPIGLYLERFVLSGLRGPVALAYYSAPQELMLKLHLLPAAVTGGLFPAFSGLSARGDAAELLRQVRRGARIIALLLAVPAAVLVATAEPLLTVWLGSDYGVRSSGVMRLLGLAVFLNGLAYLPFVLAEGTGRPDLVAKYHLAELLPYSAALWLLTHHYGIMGTAVALTLRMTFMAPLLYALVVRSAGIGLAAPLRGTPGAAIGTSLVLLATLQLLPLVVGSGPAAALPGLLLVAGYGVFAWRHLLEAADRDALLELPSRLRARRSTTGGDRTDAGQ